MAFAGEIGWLGKNCPDHRQTKLIGKALRSNAGWFLGTICPECQLEDPSPNSRETGYYETREDLIKAMEAGTVRWRDTAYHKAELDGLIAL
jgi:hypothetical protein